MSEKVTTVDAGGGFMVDIVDSTPTNGVAKKAPRAKAKPVAKAAAAPTKKASVKKANKATAPKAPRSDTAVARDKEAASVIGCTVRGYRILRALHHPDARLSYTEIASKSGVINNHLNGQLWGEGEWGAGDRALAKLGLVKRHDGEGGVRVGLTAKGVKAIAKAAGK